MSRAEDITALTSYMAEKVHRERECGEILRHNASVLLARDSSAVFVDAELNSYSGRSDLVVVANRTDVVGSIQREAYIWELKAPQSHVFERDGTTRRFMPSRDLVKAENQLLHYHEDLRINSVKNVWGLKDITNIHVGGIVIGQKETFCKTDVRLGDELCWGYAEKAFELRREKFYHGANIELVTWSKILLDLSNISESNTSVSGGDAFVGSLSGKVHLVASRKP